MEQKSNLACLVRSSFKKMGTDIDLRIVVNNDEEHKKAEMDLFYAKQLYEKYEKTFSRFNKESELSKLNANLNKPMAASLQMIKVAALALGYCRKSEGIFDPRIIDVLEKNGYNQDFEQISKTKIEKFVDFNFFEDLNQDLKIFEDTLQFNARMDFSGIVKGWATDRVVEFLRNKDWKNFLVDSGGDMFFEGRDEKENPWYIDIEGISSEKILFELDDLAIATSGIGKRKWEIDGERFHHLINPKEPSQFSFELNSVTVISKSVADADVWAKTIFILGSKEGKMFAKKNEIACVILKYDGSAWISKKAKQHLYHQKLCVKK